MNITIKHYFIGFLFIVFLVFNGVFFNSLKKDIDYIVTEHILPVSGISEAEKMKVIMSKDFYIRNDVEELTNIAFHSYKESLMNRNMLSNHLKNVLLLNYKIVLVDNVNSKFMTNYLVNICLLISLLFAILFKERTIMGKRNEQKFEVE